ncbi:hypothetical protein ACHAW6_001406 [Cyclotella cf. meneghiniana]
MPATLQVWRDEKGLWHIPLTKPTSILSDPTLHCVNNVYDLPSTVHTVCYLHAELGFPTKTTLLSAICKSNLTRIPGLTPTRPSTNTGKTLKSSS